MALRVSVYGSVYPGGKTENDLGKPILFERIVVSCDIHHILYLVLSECYLKQVLFFVNLTASFEQKNFGEYENSIIDFWRVDVPDIWQHAIAAVS